MANKYVRLTDGSVAEDIQVEGDTVRGVRVMPNGMRVRFSTSQANWDEVSGAKAGLPGDLRFTSYTGEGVEESRATISTSSS